MPYKKELIAHILVDIDKPVDWEKFEKLQESIMDELRKLSSDVKGHSHQYQSHYSYTYFGVVDKVNLSFKEAMNWTYSVPDCRWQSARIETFLHDLVTGIEYATHYIESPECYITYVGEDEVETFIPFSETI